MVALSLYVANRRWRVPHRQELTVLARRTLRMARQTRMQGTLSVAFIGDAALRRLNRVTRGIDRVTDVLSFTYHQTSADINGEIVIAVPRARRQAASVGHDLQEELQFLFVHGFLHVMGYDHERSAREERRMFALQRRICMHS